MSQALLAVQDILQNSNIFNRSQETVLFTPFGDKKVTQFLGLLPTSVSYLKCPLYILHETFETFFTYLVPKGIRYHLMEKNWTDIMRTQLIFCTGFVQIKESQGNLEI